MNGVEGTWNIPEINQSDSGVGATWVGTGGVTWSKHPDYQILRFFLTDFLHFPYTII